jgi:predicted peptidase
MLIASGLLSCVETDITGSNPPSDTDDVTGFQEMVFTHGPDSVQIPYRFFAPGKAQDSEDTFPLIIALHGDEYSNLPPDQFLSDERTGYMALSWIQTEKQDQYPAYIVAPNLHAGLFESNGNYSRWTQPGMQSFLQDLIDLLIENHQINPSKIYLVGHSSGGTAAWRLSDALKNRIAAIVPLSHINWNLTEDNIFNKIRDGKFNNISVWNVVHRNDQQQSVNTARQIFVYLQQNGFNPVITHRLGVTQFSLTPSQIDEAIDEGRRFFYTEYSYNPCDTGSCHYSMLRALDDPLLIKWLFTQQKL